MCAGLSTRRRFAVKAFGVSTSANSCLNVRLRKYGFTNNLTQRPSTSNSRSSALTCGVRTHRYKFLSSCLRVKSGVIIAFACQLRSAKASSRVHFFNVANRCYEVAFTLLSLHRIRARLFKIFLLIYACILFNPKKLIKIHEQSIWLKERHPPPSKVSRTKSFSNQSSKEMFLSSLYMF